MRIQTVVLALATLMAAPQGERVPDAAVVNGVPQGMFVGRSLLTGRAVCLLFLSGGRITRAIPEGGLESFDWNRHFAAHGRDAGTWGMRGSQLVVAWGDGGVHQGPLTVRPDGIEFYGKRYAKPEVIDVSAIAGRWESARGTAIAGGAGINKVSALVISADGRYQRVSIIGGAVEGRSVAADRSTSGTVAVRGLTIVFTSDAGTTSSHTFLPTAGKPVNAFSVDSDMFARSGPAPEVSATRDYQGIEFTIPSGWTSSIRQGRLVLTPGSMNGNAPMAIVVSGAENLTGSFDDWIAGKMAGDLAGGSKVLQAAAPARAKSGALDVISAARTVRDSRGSVLLQLYYGFTDGQHAALALTATGNEAALKAQMPGVQAFLQSLRFGESGALRRPGN